MDAGVETHYPNGRFEIVQYNHLRQKVYTRVDDNEPLIALQRATRTLLQRHGTEADTQVLRKAATAYIKDCEARKAMEAAADGKLVLDEFVPMCNVTYVRGIRREDVLAYHTKLRKRGLTERTVANRHQRLKTFLRFCKVDISFLPPTPKYEEGLPTVYTKENIKAILDAADEQMYLVIELGLKLGLRDQELMHAEWSDIDWTHSVYRVQGRPHWKFLVKDSEQRDCPIPADLLDRLKAWRESHPETTLILGTKKGTPNTHLLRALKRLATRAGLDPKQFTLHKLRRSYITTLLRNGFDLRTVQAFAGHSDLKSTLRYIRPSEAKEMQTQLNAINWTE